MRARYGFWGFPVSRAMLRERTPALAVRRPLTGAIMFFRQRISEVFPA